MRSRGLAWVRRFHALTSPLLPLPNVSSPPPVRTMRIVRYRPSRRRGRSTSSALTPAATAAEMSTSIRQGQSSRQPWRRVGPPSSTSNLVADVADTLTLPLLPGFALAVDEALGGQGRSPMSGTPPRRLPGRTPLRPLPLPSELAAEDEAIHLRIRKAETARNFGNRQLRIDACHHVQVAPIAPCHRPGCPPVRARAEQ